MLRYLHEHDLSQSAFARLIGIRQPNVAPLKTADHEPSVSILSRLSAALGEPSTIDVDSTGTHLHAASLRCRGAGSCTAPTQHPVVASV